MTNTQAMVAEFQQNVFQSIFAPTNNSLLKNHSESFDIGYGHSVLFLNGAGVINREKCVSFQGDVEPVLFSTTIKSLDDGSGGVQRIVFQMAVDGCVVSHYVYHSPSWMFTGTALKDEVQFNNDFRRLQEKRLKHSEMVRMKASKESLKELYEDLDEMELRLLGGYGCHKPNRVGNWMFVIQRDVYISTLECPRFSSLAFSKPMKMKELDQKFVVEGMF